MGPIFKSQAFQEECREQADALLHMGWCGQRLVYTESKRISRVAGAWLFHQDLGKSTDAREKEENTEKNEKGERPGHEEKLVR